MKRVALFGVMIGCLLLTSIPDLTTAEEYKVPSSFPVGFNAPTDATRGEKLGGFGGGAAAVLRKFRRGVRAAAFQLVRHSHSPVTPGRSGPEGVTELSCPCHKNTSAFGRIEKSQQTIRVRFSS